MYELLTRHIEPLKTRVEDPYLWIRDLEDGGFADHDYFGTMERYGLGDNCQGMAIVEPVDIPRLPAQAVFALLTFVYRRDRFCDGGLIEDVESGLVPALLERLKAIDAG